MHLNQIETFLTVAKCGSFTGAGEKLFISSSAVAQQVSNLEENIGAKLFNRTTHGVTLTDIGLFFMKEGTELVERGTEIRNQIQIMNYEQENCIVLGTSMWQNCSLFYSLWGRFSSEHEGFQIRTMRISDEFRLKRTGRRPNLIESIWDGEPWQTDYSFMELCKDRIVCAVPKSHPLANRDKLRYEDIRQYDLVTAPEHLSSDLDQMAEELLAAGINIRRAKRYDFALFTECSINRWIIQIPEAWAYLLKDYRTIPCEWSYSHPYGFFYREPMNTPLRLFLEYVEQEADILRREEGRGPHS